MALEVLNDMTKRGDLTKKSAADLRPVSNRRPVREHPAESRRGPGFSSNCISFKRAKRIRSVVVVDFRGMPAAVLASSLYSALATCTLFLHALFILWLVFGALLTRSRPLLRWLHIGSLIWGILTELLWPCPLTVLENLLEAKAGLQPYQEGFLLHYLDKLVYPGISPTVLTIAGVIVCVLNLAFYGRQIWIARLH